MELFGIDVPLWLLLLLGVLFTYYKYTTALFGTFRNSPGLKGPKPWPLVGTMMPMLKKGIAAHDKELVEKYGKVVPHFLGRDPALIVVDVDMLEAILIKHFSNFTDRKPIDMPPPLDSMLTNLAGDQWKHVRNLVTHSFSPAKMRQMNDSINRCCQVLTTNLKKNGGVVDVRECMGAFTMDLIASSAFGLDIDSQSDPDNPFVANAKKAFVDDFKNPALILLVFFPFMSQLLFKFGVSFMQKDAQNFFLKLIEKAIAQKIKGDTNGTDFLQLMINAQQDEDIGSSHDDKPDNARRGLTHNEVLGQGFLFFLAGFGNVANACSFVLYCLATYPHAQDKLLEEIEETLKENNEPTYDSVQKMKYLDMVVSETLRLHTPVARVERIAKNDITLNGVFIPKGVVITIPIDHLHHDPEVYPDPDTFDPERFTEKAMSQRNPIYYMPFGVGPRHCVAIRLALLEVKMSIVNILRHFSIHTCAETDIPVKRNLLHGRPVGLKLEFKARG